MQKLGFGMMRLPMPDPKEQSRVDEAQVCAMVDRFLERGYTYFDTAYMYHGGESENVVRRTLVERHPRERFLLADKMPLFHFRPEDTEEEQAALFQEQLDKCGVTYFDYYLLHSVTAAGYEIARRLRTFEFLAEQKAQGRIRRLGFSFHDKADVLDRILTEHPEVEFVQLQLNYLDWEDERVQSRKCYETIVRHGKKVVVMEPVKGGKLAAVPEEAAALMKEAHPDWSPASWAIRFAAGLDQVMMVLSGMSSMEQLLDNTGYMQDPAPLTAEEVKLLERSAEIISALPAVACTACRYCVDGCPQKIDIPEYFALYNGDQEALRKGLTPSKAAYEKLAANGGRASDCVACRQCEGACPQHLPIVNWLSRVKSTYEG